MKNKRKDEESGSNQTEWKDKSCQMNLSASHSTRSCNLTNSNLEDSMFGFNALVTPHPLDLSPIIPVVANIKKTNDCHAFVLPFSSTALSTKAQQRRKKQQFLGPEESKAGQEEAENKLFKDLLSQFESVKNHELVVEEET